MELPKSKLSKMEIGRRIQDRLAIEAVCPIKVRQITRLAKLLDAQCTNPMPKN
jgi:hypothetical protein